MMVANKTDMLRVLVVDDEQDIREGSERILSRVGFQVITASRGEEALEKLNKVGAEIVLLDLKMPGIDGMEILKQVKATRPEIEVIVLTGHGSEADRKQCMQLGAFAYMQTPVDIDELSATLKKAHEKIQQFKS